MIRKVHASLAATCVWQNEWDLLRATAVTQGWNGYQNKSQHRKSTLEKKIPPLLLRGLEPGTFDHESGALTAELSRSPKNSTLSNLGPRFCFQSLPLLPAVVPASLEPVGR